MADTDMDPPSSKASSDEESPKARGKRNKLSKRDIRRLAIEIKRNQGNRQRTKLYRLTDLANTVKQGTDKVHRTTVSRHLKDAGFKYDNASGSWPDVKDPSRWLRQRRGFAKIYKCNNKSNILMADESFFGLKRKFRRNEKDWHQAGHRMMRDYEPMNPQHRVTVWAAIGLDYWTPLYIFEDGRWLNQDDYGRIIDGFLLPHLEHNPVQFHLGQDNATYHGGEENEHLFDGRNVDVFWLPARSPDFSWIEKGWANLAARAYKDDREYANKHDLIEALNREWEAMVSDPGYRQRLIAQAEQACRQVLSNGGYLVHWPSHP